MRVSARASGTLRPAACTIALPTTMPSASAPTALACAGVEMPNPTQMGSGQTARSRAIDDGSVDASSACMPVTPSRLMRYTNPRPWRAMSAMRSGGVVGRDEAHELERAGAEPGLALGVRPDGKVGHEHAADAGGARAVERVRACGDDRVEVGEEHDGNAEPRRGDEIERAVERHALLERLLRTRLDDRAVGHGIGERHADLEHVRSGVLEAAHEVEAPLAVRVARGHVADQRTAARRAQRGESFVQHVRGNSRRRECRSDPGPSS